jgi:hypothetical protein
MSRRAPILIGFLALAPLFAVAVETPRRTPVHRHVGGEPHDDIAVLLVERKPVVC